jgi:hypothetical protein
MARKWLPSAAQRRDDRVAAGTGVSEVPGREGRCTDPARCEERSAGSLQNGFRAGLVIPCRCVTAGPSPLDVDSRAYHRSAMLSRPGLEARLRVEPDARDLHVKSFAIPAPHRSLDAKRCCQTAACLPDTAVDISGRARTPTASMNSQVSAGFPGRRRCAVDALRATLNRQVRGSSPWRRTPGDGGLPEGAFDEHPCPVVG